MGQRADWVNTSTVLRHFLTEIKTKNKKFENWAYWADRANWADWTLRADKTFKKVLKNF